MRYKCGVWLGISSVLRYLILSLLHSIFQPLSLSQYCHRVLTSDELPSLMNLTDTTSNSPILPLILIPIFIVSIVISSAEYLPVLSLSMGIRWSNRNPVLSNYIRRPNTHKSIKTSRCDKFKASIYNYSIAYPRLKTRVFILQDEFFTIYVKDQILYIWR